MASGRNPPRRRRLPSSIPRTERSSRKRPSATPRRSTTPSRLPPRSLRGPTRRRRDAPGSFSASKSCSKIAPSNSPAPSSASTARPPRRHAATCAGASRWWSSRAGSRRCAWARFCPTSDAARRFVPLLVEAARAITVGPTDTSDQPGMGPVTTRAHADRMCELIEHGRREGAT
ncbi:MAG: aldehyde dehydrogenase family protein, partial [Rhodospirillales bacterium]|nr:aldehyde dehydrogenase family protein [Acetobacter sp.]